MSCEGFRVQFRSESSFDETLPGTLVPAGFALPMWGPPELTFVAWGDSLRRFGTVTSCFDYQLVAVKRDSRRLGVAAADTSGSIRACTGASLVDVNPPESIKVCVCVWSHKVMKIISYPTTQGDTFLMSLIWPSEIQDHGFWEMLLRKDCLCSVYATLGNDLLYTASEKTGGKLQPIHRIGWAAAARHAMPKPTIIWIWNGFIICFQT
jgi:hypothetical protein